MKLDDIRAAVEAKYVAFEIEDIGVRLRNALRVDSATRSKLTGLKESLKAEGADQVALVEEALRSVAETKAQGDKLIKALDHDLGMLLELFSEYGKATQVGEASASPE